MVTKEQNQGTQPAQSTPPAAPSPDTETVGQRSEHNAYQRSGRPGFSTSRHHASRQGQQPPGALVGNTAEHLGWGRRQSEEQQSHVEHTHHWHGHSIPAQPPPYPSHMYDWPQGQPVPYLAQSAWSTWGPWGALHCCAQCDASTPWRRMAIRAACCPRT